MSAIYKGAKEAYPIVRQLENITVKKAQAKVVKCAKNKSWVLGAPLGHLSVKGALDKYNITPQLFPKKVEFFIPLEVLTWVMSACRVSRSKLTYF